jgi:hypothetical protein
VEEKRRISFRLARKREKCVKPLIGSATVAEEVMEEEKVEEEEDFFNSAPAAQRTQRSRKGSCASR